MRLLFFFFLFILVTNSFAEELFVNYLKPVNKKSEGFVQKNRKRNPMEEPVLLLPQVKAKQDGLIENLFQLKAILYNPKSKKAYINNELYMEGDSIDGYKIKTIFIDAVVLSKDNKDFVLKIE